MISALVDFCLSEMLPRGWSILISTEVAIAGALGIAAAVFGAGVGVAASSTGDVVLALLAYAAIAFGFSLAGLTLVLTAPDRAFAQELAWSDPGREGGVAPTAPQKSSFANLLFIFSWTAIAHWAVVVASFTILVVLGKDIPLLADGSSIKHRIAVGVLVFLAVYAIALFLITVVTLTQVGQAYISRLHRTPPE